VRGRAGVQQGQPGDPVGGLTQDLEADVAAHRQPGQGEAGGASARIRLAMAAMVSSRVLSAMVTGPCCHRAESWAAYTRGEVNRPGTSTIGSGSAIWGPPWCGDVHQRLDDGVVDGGGGHHTNQQPVPPTHRVPGPIPTQATSTMGPACDSGPVEADHRTGQQHQREPPPRVRHWGAR
jgi:hypothetical protein